MNGVMSEKQYAAPGTGGGSRSNGNGATAHYSRGWMAHVPGHPGQAFSNYDSMLLKFT